MPKETRSLSLSHASASTAAAAAPYPSASEHNPKNGTMWSSTDDEVLLRARAGGLNWQKMARDHFPSKTANACRKRHERLIEKRNIEDWDTNKLELLAQEYMAQRSKMWELIAARLGEKWTVVEAKCMEKGLKTLHTVARTAAKRTVGSMSIPDHGPFDQTSDSGIDLSSEIIRSGSREATASTDVSPLIAAPPSHPSSHHEHTRTRSLPQPIPLYQPPAPIMPPYNFERSRGVTYRRFTGPEAGPSDRRCSPDSQSGRVSIQSVLSD